MKAILVVAVALSLPAQAHRGDIVYPVFELPTADLPDLHDESMEDWESVLVPSIDQRHFLTLYDEGQSTRAVVDEEELAFQIYLAWNHASQRIYVGAQRFDSQHLFRLPPEPSTIPRGAPLEVPSHDCCHVWDHLGIRVDGDHSGDEACVLGGFPSLEQRARVDNVECQQYQVVPEAQGTQQIRFRSYGSPWATDPVYMDAGGSRIGEAPTVSTYEFYITPWDELTDDVATSLRTQLEPGAIIGLQIEMWDFDDDVDWLNTEFGSEIPFAIYSIGGQGGHADSFVDAELIPCEGRDCSGGVVSAVVPESWGRIKASLR